MTMIRDLDIKCSACGEMSSQPILFSTNSIGAPDLDLRPPEMQRSTMNTWLMECPHCGYISPKLDGELEISKDFLKTDRYINCDGLEFEWELAERFYRYYLICNEMNDESGSFYSLLHCAWICDDVEDVKNARKMRKMAIAHIDKLIRLDDEDKDTYLLIKADLLRRIGEFSQLIEEYKDLITGDELMDKIVKFQIMKSKEGDDTCYTVEDVKFSMIRK